MQGLVSNGQQEEESNPPSPPPPPPNPTFFTEFLPTRAISCFVSSMGRSYLYLNVNKAEGLFIAYSIQVVSLIGCSRYWEIKQNWTIYIIKPL